MPVTDFYVYLCYFTVTLSIGVVCALFYSVHYLFQAIINVFSCEQEQLTTSLLYK